MDYTKGDSFGLLIYWERGKTKLTFKSFNIKIRYPISQEDRRIWMHRRLDWKQSSIADFSKTAKQIEKGELDGLKAQLWMQSSERKMKDFSGLDHPREDIVSFKSKSGRLVFVGSDLRQHREILKNTVEDVINNYFTKKEIKDMKQLYFEASKPKIEDASGVHERFIGYSIITINPDSLNDHLVVTHELVHALRDARREHVLDRDRSEKETELEAVARVPRSQLSIAAGYYYCIPEVEELLNKRQLFQAYSLAQKLALEDKKLIEDYAKKKNISEIKGEKLRQIVKEVYPYTHISRAHFSPGEELDRYFYVKKEKQEAFVHIRFNKPQTMEQLKTSLRKAYGTDAEIWEYKNGKKVKILP